MLFNNLFSFIFKGKAAFTQIHSPYYDYDEI